MLKITLALLILLSLNAFAYEEACDSILHPYEKIEEAHDAILTLGSPLWSSRADSAPQLFSFIKQTIDESSRTVQVALAAPGNDLAVYDTIVKLNTLQILLRTVKVITNVTESEVLVELHKIAAQISYPITLALESLHQKPEFNFLYGQLSYAEELLESARTALPAQLEYLQAHSAEVEDLIGVAKALNRHQRVYKDLWLAAKLSAIESTKPLGLVDARIRAESVFTFGWGSRWSRSPKVSHFSYALHEGRDTYLRQQDRELNYGATSRMMHDEVVGRSLEVTDGEGRRISGRVLSVALTSDHQAVELLMFDETQAVRTLRFGVGKMIQFRDSRGADEFNPRLAYSGRRVEVRFVKQTPEGLRRSLPLNGDLVQQSTDELKLRLRDGQIVSIPLFESPTAWLEIRTKLP